jgi:hypothetical protein
MSHGEIALELRQIQRKGGKDPGSSPGRLRGL